MYEKSPGKKAKSDQGENDEYSLSSYKYLVANLPNLFSNIGSLLSNWTFQLEGFLLGFKSLSTDKILILTTLGLSSSGKSILASTFDKGSIDQLSTPSCQNSN